MAKILEMPKLSPTMEEGVLSAWHKKEGDAVAVDDLLAEVETDKATMEFRAFDAGDAAQGPGARRGAGEARPAGRHPRCGRARTSPRWSRRRSPPAPAHPRPRASKRAPPRRPGRRHLPAPPQWPRPRPSGETAPPPAVREPPVGHVLERTAFAPEALTAQRVRGPRIACSRRRTCARSRERWASTCRARREAGPAGAFAVRPGAAAHPGADIAGEGDHRFAGRGPRSRPGPGGA